MMASLPTSVQFASRWATVLTRRPFARSRAVAKGAVVDVVLAPAATATATTILVTVTAIKIVVLIVVAGAAPEAADAGDHARGARSHVAVKSWAT